MMLTLVGLAALVAAVSENAPAEATSTQHDAECFSRAVKAADREYSKYYQADWYIDLRAIVQANEVQSIEVHVGPYDGSAGGGIAARYDCVAGWLITLEQER